MYCRNREIDDAVRRLMMPAASLAHHGPGGPAPKTGSFGSYPRGRPSQRTWAMTVLAKPMTGTTAIQATRNFLGDPLQHVIV